MADNVKTKSPVTSMRDIRVLPGRAEFFVVVRFFHDIFFVSARVYRTKKAMRSQVRKMTSLADPSDVNGFATCCSGGSHTVYVWLNAESLGGGYLAHEIQHVVDFLTPLSAYRAMCKGKWWKHVDPKGEIALDPFEERALIMGELVRTFWSWWYDSGEKHLLKKVATETAK